MLAVLFWSLTYISSVNFPQFCHFKLLFYSISSFQRESFIRLRLFFTQFILQTSQSTNLSYISYVTQAVSGLSASPNSSMISEGVFSFLSSDSDYFASLCLFLFSRSAQEYENCIFLLSITLLSSVQSYTFDLIFFYVFRQISLRQLNKQP